MEKPSKVLWFTDLHLRAPADPEANKAESRFQSCLTHALTHHADADLCIISGDIANDGQAAEYAVYARLMADFPIPVRVLMGNHDDRAALASIANAERSPAGTLIGTMRVGANQVLWLDTNVPGADGGHVGEADLAWLETQLDHAERPTLIFMHHHPGQVFLPSFDGIGVDNSEALHAVLRRHRDAAAHIFFGHCHLPISGSIAGIGITGLPAVAPQQRANFDTPEFLADREGEPCYGVIIGNSDTVICHTIRVR